jgi:hypothetical protein
VTKSLFSKRCICLYRLDCELKFCLIPINPIRPRLTLLCLLFVVVFEIYSSDGNYVLQDDMESLLLASEGGKVPVSIKQLFALVSLPIYVDVFNFFYFTGKGLEICLNFSLLKVGSPC